MKIYLSQIIICLTVALQVNAQGVLPDTTLVNLYGGIRADMTRAACEIADFKDTVVLNKIENSSLTQFQSALQTTNQELYEIVRKSIKPLSLNKTVDEYASLVNGMRLKYKAELNNVYRVKESDIDARFGEFRSVIDELTKECKCFIDSVEAYRKDYKNGRFIALLPEVETQDGFGANEDNCGESFKGNTVSLKDQTTQGERRFFGNILCILKCLMILVIIFVVLFVALLVAYIKRKEIEKMCSKIKNMLRGEEEMIEETDSPMPLPTPAPILPPQPEPTPQPEPLPKPDPSPEPMSNDIVAYSKNAGEWIVVGASVQGNGHISSNIPCQDYSAYEYLGEGWGIAITSDGAGSAKHADVGSKITVARTLHYMKTIVEREGWIEKNVLPSEIRWTKLALKGLRLVHDDIQKFAEAKEIEFKSLNATVIVVIHSPLGLLAAHVGDGRSGYRDMNGEWHSISTPHKGEEANQTIFIPSEFWDIPFYEMSGVMVPETRVINQPVSAFTLMSDGCENTSWLCNQINKTTGKFYDPNTPHKGFFEPLFKKLQQSKAQGKSENERAKDWYQFIKDGNQKFQDEIDDKSMILGVLYM